MRSSRKKGKPQHPTPNASRLVLFLDEIDIIRTLPFSADEFFMGIRQCYVGRATDATLNRLTFCLMGTATPADLIQDTRTSPFNIGKRIEVRDFTPQEAKPLANGLNHDEHGGHGEKLLERVLYWTGGHPYLTQRLCRAVADAASSSTPNAQHPTPDDVDKLCTELFLTHKAKESDDNLMFVRNRLLKSEVDLAALLDLYGQMRSGKRVPDDETNPLTSVLKLSGVARVENGLLKVRNRIYDHVFDKTWITAHLPDAELRRQKAAFRRGVLRSAAVFTVIVALLGGLVWKAVREARRADANARRADAQTALAKQETELARLRLYVADMNLAQQTWDSGGLPAVLPLVEAHQPQPGQSDVRDFAWRHLWRLSHSESDQFALKAGTNQIGSCAFTPDGRFLATEQNDVGDDGANDRVKLWDVQAQRPVAVFTGYGPEVHINNVAISPDGKRLAIACSKNAMLWEIATQKRLAVFPTTNSALWSAFSPNRKLLATANDDGVTQLWDTATYKEVARLTEDRGNNIDSVAFSPEGRLLATASQDNVARLWNLRTKRLVATLKGHRDRVYAVAFSPDGKMLASASADATAKIWDVRTWQEIATLRLQPNFGMSKHALCFSPDGKFLATPSDDFTVILWDVKTKRRLAMLRGHQGGVQSAAFLPNGKTLVSTGSDGTVRFWNVETEIARAVIGTLSNNVRCLTPSAGGRFIATGFEDGTVRMADTSTGLFPAIPGLRVPNLRDIAPFPDGKTIATVQGNNTVMLWEAQTGRAAATFAGGKTEQFFALALSPDGRTLAAGSQNGVTLWNTTTRQRIATTPGYGRWGGNLNFTSDGRFLEIGSIGISLKLWDMKTKREETAFGHDLVFATVSSDGKVLATSGSQDIAFFPPKGRMTRSFSDKRIHLWIIASKRESGVLPGLDNKNWTISAVFSPDGKTLAAGGGGGQVKLWDVATRREKARLIGHVQVVKVVAFSPDGKTLATGGDDGVVRLWYLTTGQPIAVSNENQGRIDMLDFAQDGNALFAWGQKGLRIWRAAPFAETDRKQDR